MNTQYRYFASTPKYKLDFHIVLVCKCIKQIKDIVAIYSMLT